MDLEYFRQHCLAKKGVTEGFPFDEHTLVFKVMGKMFALTGLKREEFAINLKCDPERAEELRDLHPEITPGYHMSKKHWNTVNCEGSLDGKLILELIDHSYDLVVSSLTKKIRLELDSL
jgi:predicted DNA-binding protein (MmcQ/YjbR family)